ncbi:MAG: hypothetical protein KAJ07_00165, partial [Planctomycetes bacterium]|nr:hypothetical protein [Planctomycetota bacterium]
KKNTIKRTFFYIIRIDLDERRLISFLPSWEWGTLCALLPFFYPHIAMPKDKPILTCYAKFRPGTI